MLRQRGGVKKMILLAFVSYSVWKLCIAIFKAIFKNNPVTGFVIGTVAWAIAEMLINMIIYEGTFGISLAITCILFVLNLVCQFVIGNTFLSDWLW